MEKKSHCFNKLMSEQGLVDKFFTTFKNVVKTYGIFYHLSENWRETDRKSPATKEDNEFLQLSIFTVMELIEGDSTSMSCCNISVLTHSLKVAHCTIYVGESPSSIVPRQRFSRQFV